MLFIIFSLIVCLGLSCMTFVDYYNGRLKAAAISCVLALVQIGIIVNELIEIL
jgi:hypothetical protein